MRQQKLEFSEKINSGDPHEKIKVYRNQIASVLKQVESGLKVDDVCRQCGLVQRRTTTGKQNTVAWRPLNSRNVIDEGTREFLSIKVDTSLPAQRVIRTLERLKDQRRLPKQIRLDNGPELRSTQFVDWCELNHIELAYIKPGKPQQNGFAERFNGSFRRDFLNAYLFEKLTHVRNTLVDSYCYDNRQR